MAAPPTMSAPGRSAASSWPLEAACVMRRNRLSYERNKNLRIESAPARVSTVRPIAARALNNYGSILVLPPRGRPNPMTRRLPRPMIVQRRATDPFTSAMT